MSEGRARRVAGLDDFLAGLEPDARAAFERLVRLVRGEVPEAEPGTSYGMAALRYRGRPLVGFAEAKRHLSLFPFSPEVVDAVRGRLEGFDLSKGTIRFTVDHPLPDDVVADVARLRAAEIGAAAR